MSGTEPEEDDAVQGSLFGQKIAARPFVKWAGGKQALVPVLLDRFPAAFERYFEPFVGGGSVFFALAPEQAVLSDHNGWLVDTYRAVRARWRAVAGQLDRLKNTRRDYLEARAIDPASLDRTGRAALFIYLNKTCFRGLFRVNREGRFNVPWGAYDRRTYDPAELNAAARALRGAELRTGDFSAGLEGIARGDFAYFDPPYGKLGGYSDFDRYTELKFREADHRRLAAACRDLDRQGVRFALSNSDTPLIRELYAAFRIETLSARREINLYSRSRDIKELLVTNS